MLWLQLLHRTGAAADCRRPGDDEREPSGIRSAETARSKEALGARELLRLDPYAFWGFWGSSSCELFRLWASFSLVIELRLLPTGVLDLEIQTPSTSIPL